MVTPKDLTPQEQSLATSSVGKDPLALISDLKSQYRCFTAGFYYPSDEAGHNKNKRAKPMKMNLKLGDKVVAAEKVEFNPITENWSLYRLEDGSVVRLRLIVSEIFKLPGSDPITGMPQYLAKSTNIMAVEPPRSSMTNAKEVH